ncbi:Crystal protein ET79 (plasmid) [Streptomyces californicus]|uniref:Crystal protein ET79 n=1 Tax=Streptomyces californicus TaxID=67351 RepID=A0ABD7DC11_9ACTN|nr:MULTISPECIES: aegerolysin family protein [Streptomyces]QRV32440.1 Crystal protein ET79 [Streptomyces californicus]QRV39173.1 Crystal protein ET79 [Streptomyces californicus]QRV45856.1 Crystal protein ET79 [Streptomyces californicus]QRV52626.1 Crystal protein ET79 [Streptomyces californicus]
MFLKPTSRSSRTTIRSILTTAALLGSALALVPATHAVAATTPASASSTAGAFSGTGAESPVSTLAQRSTRITVTNSTGQGMQRVWSKLSHGCWTNDELPPDNIPAGRSTAFGSESCGLATGTEGETNFAVPGGQVEIRWNNPFVGSNSYSCTTPSGYYCSRSGGSGNNANVHFTIAYAGLRAAATTGAPGAPVEDGTVSAQAARSTHVTLNNNSGALLSRTDARLSWGIWSDNQLPAVNINPGNRSSWQSESDGFMTGTQGSVTYVVSTGGHVTVKWNNPYAGSNKYECIAPANRTCSYSGGSGDNATVSFTLS